MPTHRRLNRFVAMVRDRFARGSFARDTAVVASGTAIAQAITILSAPFLTRLYAPEDYGLFALVMSVGSVLSIAATARYEMAILLPDEESEAVVVAILAAGLAFVVSLAAFVGVFALIYPLAAALGKPLSPWFCAVPVLVAVSGAQQALLFWTNRKKQYSRLSMNQIVLAGGAAAVSVGLGFAGAGAAGLILGSLTAQTVAMALLTWHARQDLLRAMTPGVFSVMKEKARQYRRFPMFCVPADCLNGAAQQAPVVLLSLFFGPAVAGSFSLTHRVLSMPLVLLSQSIGGVFRQRASSQYNSRGDCRDVFSKTFKGLVLLSLVPFPLLFVAAPWLFCVVFGDQWRMAGEYARLLVPLFLVRFVSSPLTYVFYLREKQHYDLLGVTALLAASLSSMYVGNSLGSATAAITLFSALTCLVYLAYLLASQFLAQGNRQSVLTRAGRTVGQ